MTRLAVRGLLAALSIFLVAQACTRLDIVTVRVAEIVVRPRPVTIFEGDTITLEAIVRDDRGRELPAEVVWKSNDPATVSVSSTGLVLGIAAGRSDVVASFNGTAGQTTVTVLKGPGIQVTPDALLFHGAPGQPAPAPRTIAVSNTSERALEGLEVAVGYAETGARGWLQAELSGSSAPAVVTVTTTTSVLGVGVHVGSVIVTSESDTVEVPVRLTMASMSVSATGGGSTVTEIGGTDRLDVVLELRPESQVVLDVTSSDPTEVAVSPTTLIFTSDDWDVPQPITLMGVDDGVIDGDQVTSITVSVDDAQSDSAYGPVPDATQAVTTIDDDVGLTFAPTDGGTSAAEGGATDTVTVVLAVRPTSDVFVELAVDDPADASIGPTTLTFTPDDWGTPKPAEFRAEDDAVADGTRNRTITATIGSGSDPSFLSIPPRTLPATTLDDETAGFTVTQTNGSTVAVEGGRTDSIQVVLNAEPVGLVGIEVLVDDPQDAFVDPSTLAFTGNNWSRPQTVQFGAIDESTIDGNGSREITVRIISNSDPAFAALPAQTVPATTIDDDGADIAVTQTNGSTVSAEGGAPDSIAVALVGQPLSDVVIDVSVDLPSDATVEPATLRFTTGNSATPQWVVYSAVDDDVPDGDGARTITLSVDAASDPIFTGLPDRTVAASTVDDDRAGFLVSETGGTTTVNESASTDAITVVLTAAPLSDVELTVTSANLAEVTAAPTTLTFSPDDWSQAQTVTLTGVDDATADGDRTTQVSIAVTATSDPEFAALAPQNISVTTVDDDVVGFTVAESDGSTSVSEDGSLTDVITVRLNSLPIDDVVFLVTASDPSEAAVTPGSLTFTPANGTTPQQISVRGVDDAVVDGPVASLVTVSVDPGATQDPGYPGLPARTVVVTTTDDEVAGITLTNTVGKAVDEAGTIQDAFSVALDAEPTGDVVLTVSSSDAGEVTAQPTTLTFTPQSFGTPQLVTLSGADDDIDDGDRLSTVTVAVNQPLTVAGYDGVPARTVTVTTTDDDVAGITLTNAAGKTVDESGATQDAFSVVLDSEPTSNVVLSLSSSDNGEVTTQPTTLTFTPQSWSTPQVVTLIGVDDLIADGTQVSTVTVAVNDVQSDDAYDGVADETVTVTTTDDDVPGITLTDAAAKTVDEAGTTDAFSVVLDTQPSSNVVLTVTSSNTNEVTVQPATLTFTSQSWATPQAVTLSGVDDDVTDGDRISTITVSVDANLSDDTYDGVSAATLSVTTTDDDVPGITLTNTAAKTVDEAGTTQDVFSVALDVGPTSDVVVSVTSSNTGEVTVQPATLTFTPLNYATPQNVTLLGVDDDIVDGDQLSTVTVSVLDAQSDPAYADVPDESVTVTTTDDDTPGMTLLNADDKTLDESGATTDAFSVVLDAQPEGDVVLTVSSSDDGQLTVQPTTLTFTPQNFGTPQSVTLTAIDDDLIDGDQTATVTVAVDDALSADDYDDVPNETVLVTIVDDEEADFEIIESGGTTVVTEAGGTDSFQVVLTARPNSPVRLSVQSADPGEVTVSQTELSFSPGQWNVPLTVTVTGVDDAIADGDVITLVTVSVIDARSDDLWDAAPDRSVSVTTVDDEVDGSR